MQNGHRLVIGDWSQISAGADAIFGGLGASRARLRKPQLSCRLYVMHASIPSPSLGVLCLALIIPWSCPSPALSLSLSLSLSLPLSCPELCFAQSMSTPTPEASGPTCPALQRLLPSPKHQTVRSVNLSTKMMINCKPNLEHMSPISSESETR